MSRCGPVGRDCIEKKSTQTFNCSVTCEGVYADVHWITDIIKEEVEDKLVEEEVEVKLLPGEVGDELKKMQKQLSDMKLMHKSLRKEMEASFGKRGEELDREKYMKLLAEYKTFKKNNVRHFRFNSEANSSGFGECPFYDVDTKCVESGVELHSTLQLVQIYFDTATFDDIERDKKIKTEAQLSLIGGTMGLLGGFSIISGIEIIFFLFRLVGSFRITGTVSATERKFQNN